MKKLLLTLTVLAFCISGYAQTPEEMKAWQANMTPGENHKWLATFDGEWIGDVKMWSDPSQPPTESKMISKNEMIMNGLYQRSTHSGDMMGMPFKGEGMMGYDNAQKKFVTTWFDNMGSGIMYMEGEFLDDTKVLITRGMMTDPITGQPVQVKQILKYIDDNNHVFEMFMMVGDQEFKTMEINYTRK